MDKNKAALVCVEDKSGGWTVYLAALPGIVVEVENLSDAPEKISNALNDILKWGFDNNVHIIHKKR